MWWWWWRNQRWEMRAPFLCLYLVTHSPATMCADVDSYKFRSHELFLHDTLDLSSSSSLSLSFIPLLISQLRCCASGDAIWVLITWCLCSAEQVLCSGSPHPRRRLPSEWVTAQGEKASRAPCRSPTCLSWAPRAFPSACPLSFQNSRAHLHSHHRSRTFDPHGKLVAF